jgi:hypothetical protein
MQNFQQYLIFQTLPQVMAPPVEVHTSTWRKSDRDWQQQITVFINVSNIFVSTELLGRNQ